MDVSRDPPPQFRTALDRLHEVVASETSGSDFGPDDYLPGLKVLLQSMDYDPHFSEMGRRAAWGMLVDVLKGRVHAIQSMKENPNFAAEPILDPVVITGVPRTGTTALHRLMAVDPRFQGLQTWVIDSPMPRPPMERWADYPEFQKSVANVEAHYAVAPDSRAAHHRAAEEVHECCMLLRQSFVANTWCNGWSAASYDAWWQATSEWPSYRHYYRCVQLIGSNEPEKRWLLKNPGHIENLDLLFAVFPDAKVIQTHRDPGKAMPSLCSLLMSLHSFMEEGRFEQHAQMTMAREVAKWSNAVRKCDKVREAHPEQVIDVVHGDFHRDPLAVLERIYAFIGMEITEKLRSGFARRIEEKPELAHGVHRYDIAEFGMTQEEARAPFGDYVERFDLLNNQESRL